MLLAQEKKDDLVKRIVDTAHPLRIILFGSVARGTEDPESDIDVMVVVPDGVHRLKTAQAIEVALSGFRLDVDVVVATPSDLEKYGDTPGYVYRKVLRDGIDLYAA